MARSDKAPSNAREFAIQRELIISSRRCLHLGFLSWWPLLGLILGPAALMYHVRAGHLRHKVWNPVDWQRQVGGILAIISIPWSIVLPLLIIGGGLNNANEPIIFTIAVSLALIFFGTGLWIMCQIVRIGFLKKRWTRMAAAMIPMTAWIYLWMVLLLKQQALQPVLFIGYWLVIISPLVLLAVGLCNCRLNAYFHRHPWVTATCLLVPCVLLYVGWPSYALASWASYRYFSQMWLAVIALAAQTALVVLLYRLAHRFISSVAKFAEDKPDLLLIYLIATWMTSGLAILVFFFVDGPRFH